MPVTRPCHTCGASVTRRSATPTQRLFCSRDCLLTWRRSGVYAGENNPAWKGGHTEYRGPNWRTQRRLARERDGNTCQSCGLTAPRLPVHHIRPFHLFSHYRDANVLENLTTLCHPCHGRADAAFWREHPELEQFWAKPAFPYPVACERCGASFQPRNNKHRICDGCRETVCERCGTTFVNPTPTVRKARYCSVACDMAHRQVRGIIHAERTCEGCGATFTSKHRAARFCSQRCHLTKANPRRQFFEARKRAAQG